MSDQTTIEVHDCSVERYTDITSSGKVKEETGHDMARGESRERPGIVTNWPSSGEWCLVALANPAVLEIVSAGNLANGLYFRPLRRSV